MASNRVWSVKSVLDWTTKYLSEVSGSPRADAEILLSHVMKRNRLWLYTNFDFVLPHDVLDKYREAVKLRHDGTPVQHITGEKYFMALKFKINDKVLVPRPETEELVERLLMDARVSGWKRFLDVGTGSGVISISIAKYIPDAEVWAIDVSEDALNLTRENAERHGVSKRIHVHKGHIDLKNIDVVVSNPPYLTEEEWEILKELHGEPIKALVGGEDGNDVYKEILQKYSPKRFYFEIAHPFRKSLQRLFDENGLEYEIFKDLSKKDRIAIVWRQNGTDTFS